MKESGVEKGTVGMPCRQCFRYKSHEGMSPGRIGELFLLNRHLTSSTVVTIAAVLGGRFAANSNTRIVAFPDLHVLRTAC